MNRRAVPRGVERILSATGGLVYALKSLQYFLGIDFVGAVEKASNHFVEWRR